MKEIKLYTERQMQVAAFLGGPISVGILFYHNFKRLDQQKKALIATLVSIILIILICFSYFTNPEGLIANMPRYGLPVLYAICTYFAYRVYLHKVVQQVTKEVTIVPASNWHVAGFTMLGFIPTAALVFVAVWFAPEFSGSFKAYNNDRIYYARSGITESDLDKLAGHMTNFGYFGQDLDYEIKLENMGTHLEVSLPYLSAYWWDPQEMTIIVNEAKIIEADFGVPVVIVLRDYNGRGDLITKRMNDTDL